MAWSAEGAEILLQRNMLKGEVQCLLGSIDSQYYGCKSGLVLLVVCRQLGLRYCSAAWSALVQLLLVATCCGTCVLCVCCSVVSCADVDVTSVQYGIIYSIELNAVPAGTSECCSLLYWRCGC